MLPKLTDGQINYRDKGWFGEEAGQIVERTRETLNATHAAKLLEVINHIDREDPEFIARHIKSLSSFSASNLAIVLHIVGAQKDLQDALLAERKDMDCFLLRIAERREDFQDNEFYPLDYLLSSPREWISSAYVREKMADVVASPGEDSDDRIREILQFAVRFGVDSEALEDINLKTPLPKSLARLHQRGADALSTKLITDPEFSLWLLEQRKKFVGMSDDEKMEVGRKFLEILSASYGVYPPPALEKDKISSNAEHEVWDSYNRDACFAHPLGRILLNADGMPNDFSDFMNSLAHEFTHGLEELAILSLNPDFQAWRAAEGDRLGVRIAARDLENDFRATGLLMSFNGTSGNPGIKGAEGHVYSRGEYYRGSDEPLSNDATPEQKELRIKKIGRYLNQVQERDAFGNGGRLEKLVAESLDMTEKSRDHWAVMRMSLNQMLSVRDFVKTSLWPNVPEALRDQYRLSIEGIEQSFINNEKRGASYKERMLSVYAGHSGFIALFLDAHRNNIIKDEDTSAWDVALASKKIEKLAAYATFILDRNERLASSKPEMRQQPLPG